METTITKIKELKEWYEKRIKHFNQRVDNLTTNDKDATHLCSMIEAYEVVIHDLRDIILDALLEQEKKQQARLDRAYKLYEDFNDTFLYPRVKDNYEKEYKAIISIRKEIAEVRKGK